MAVYGRLKSKYTAKWNLWMVQGGPNRKGKGKAIDFDAFVFSNAETRNKMFYVREVPDAPPIGVKNSHVADLVAGNTKYLGHSVSQACPGLAMSAAMIVSNLPVHLSVVLAEMYGDCEEGGYTHIFLKYANAIHFNREDKRLYDLYLKEESKQRDTKKRSQKKPPEPSLAVTSDEVFDQALAAAGNEEQSMISGKILDAGADHEEDKYIDNTEEKNMKESIAGEVNKAVSEPNTGSQPLYAMASHKIRRKWDEIATFYNLLKLKATFMWSKRATYMMDAAFVHRQTGIGKGGDIVQPDALNAAGLLSADSELHHKGARNATILMTSIIGRSIHYAMTKPTDFRGLAREAPWTDALVVDALVGEDEDDNNSKDDFDTQEREVLQEDSNWQLDDLLRTEGSTSKLHTGIIRQGAYPIHQSLHVDNHLALNNPILRKMYFNEEMTADEWLKLGYVVDLPLSQEGSWLRVAIPDPKTTTFYMTWIYIRTDQC